MTKTNQTTGESGDVAISQTRLALDRTILANERTYSAWIRTGLAALATGLATVKFLDELLPLWSLRMIATVLIGFGAAAFLLAAWRYSHLHIKVSHLDVDVIPLSVIRILSFILTCISITALVYAWSATF